MTALSFLHPWLLVGLAAATLPVIIHLIGKRRAPQVFFAAFDFLLAVNKRLARRERLRQFLLLLFRTLAIISAVFAVARPMPPRVAATTSTDAQRTALVIDASASMNFIKDGKSLLERSKAQARDALSHLDPGDPVSLVIAGAELHAPFQTPNSDHALVRKAIDAVNSAQGVADLGAAIEMAVSQFGDRAAGATVMVFGDLAENGFEHLRPSSLEPPPSIILVDAAEREPMQALPNLAIEAVRVVRGGGNSTERTIRVTLRNFGQTPVNGQSLELLFGGAVTHSASVDVAARSSVEKVFTYNFEAPGVFEGSVRLAGQTAGGYRIDDRAEFIAGVSPGIRVLAINGDPRMVPYEDELFFAERALAAVPEGDAPIEQHLVTADEFAAGDIALEGFDVVMLANVGELPRAVVDDLRRFTDNGGGLLLCVGHRVRFEKANDVFAGLLPHALRDLHRAADAAAGTPPLGLGDLDWRHPILLGLGKAVEESLRASRTASYYNLDVGAGIKARTILRYSNGAPLLIEQKRNAKGRVIMLTTSIDVDMSTLALQSAFPALLQNTVRYLADAMDIGGVSTIRGGESVELPLPTGAQGLALVHPDGRRFEISAQESGGQYVEFSGLTDAGVYHAEVLRDAWQRLPALDIAVNPSLAESDFQPISEQRIAGEMGQGEGDEAVALSAGVDRRRDPFAQRGYAPYLLLALGLLFVGESLLASRG